MLGWFKKKFGKKQAEEEIREPERPEEEAAVAEPGEEPAQAAAVETALEEETPSPEIPEEESELPVEGLDEKPDAEVEPAPVVHEDGTAEEDFFSSASPQQDIAFDIAGELEAFFPEPEPEPEPEICDALPEPALEPEELAEAVEEPILSEVAEVESEELVEEGEDLLDEPLPAEQEPLAETTIIEPESLVAETVELDAGETLEAEPADEAFVESVAEELNESPALVDAQSAEALVEAPGEEGGEPFAQQAELVAGETAESPVESSAGDEPQESDRDIVPAAPLAEKTQEKPASKSLFKRLRDRLGKTRDAFVYRIDQLFLGKKEIDQDLFEQLEEILITADLGVSTTLELMDRARKKVKRDQLSDPQALKNIIREEILAYIEASEQPAELVMPEEGPFVIMVVGVNGVGKTTTIGKVAAKFVRSGQSVLLVAADTFRAAAINQLRIWGERVGTEVIAQKPGADPSSVVFDGLEYGVAHGYDVVLVDTAGRLHTSVNLMEELKKIKRVMGKKMPGAPHEVLLVLDATTGQNGISQAKMFHEAVGVSGLALTKLDGTAKGGIVANVCRELGIPVRFIGIGEQIDDLRDFEAREFVDALFAEPDR